MSEGSKGFQVMVANLDDIEKAFENCERRKTGVDFKDATLGEVEIVMKRVNSMIALIENALDFSAPPLDKTKH